MNCAFVIPVYRHGSTLEDVVKSLLPYKLPIIVVDDGNEAEEAALIAQVAERHSEVIIVKHAKNGGKGAAMTSAVRKAQELGFTHVFQIDADGQHDVSCCGFFLDAAQKNQETLICGYPLYDSSAPVLRLNGRKFSNAWARFVSWNYRIVDSLCGCRIYPVKPYSELLRHHAVIDSRMGYDADILVRLLWKGVKLISLPVKVTYAKDGVSNFRMVRDNVHISVTYARLCVGMILRLPILVFRFIARGCK